MKVSIILPSLDRPNRLLATLKNLKYTTSNLTKHEIETVIILDEDDLTSQTLMNRNGYSFIISPPNSTPIYKWNFGAQNSSGQWIYQCSDDIVHPINWLDQALETPNLGFLAINDGKIGKNFEPFYLATRDWLIENQNGVLAVPHYRHWGNDLEIAGRARRLSHYRTALGVTLDHMHYLFNKAKKDSTYKKAEKFYSRDLELFRKRESLNFPNDFEGVL